MVECIIYTYLLMITQTVRILKSYQTEKRIEDIKN
jgi:hypothetical protein